MNHEERVGKANQERRDAEERKRAAESAFADLAMLTYPRPNEDADAALEDVRRAEQDIAYWAGAVAALRGRLSFDDGYPFGRAGGG